MGRFLEMPLIPNNATSAPCGIYSPLSVPGSYEEAGATLE